jgi:hypothetical protein
MSDLVIPSTTRCPLPTKKATTKVMAAKQLSMVLMNTALVFLLLTIYLVYSFNVLSSQGFLSIGIQRSKNMLTVKACTLELPDKTGARNAVTQAREKFREARNVHSACKCDRNFQRQDDDQGSQCKEPTSKHVLLSDSQILGILENKTVAFLGDSVIRQEECNLRCLLRESFLRSEARVYKKVLVEVFHFQRNISIFFLKIGLPWSHGGPRNGVDLIFQEADIIYWNVGNHYSNGSQLKSELQAYWDVYSALRKPSRRPTVLFRLQNPAHFQTVDGQMSSTPLVIGQSLGEHPACQEDSSLQINPLRSFRYQEGLSFALEHNMCYLNINELANLGCYHPGRGDCLHYDQNSWILSAINSAMLLKVSCGCQSFS